MANFSVVGQAAGSDDCGFFCGYVLGLVRKYAGNSNAMTMTQQDVYAARNKWLKENIVGPSKRWLHPAEAGLFLASVGVTGYAENRIGRITDAKKAIAYVRNALQMSPAGIMLNYFGSGLGHWVAVLSESSVKRGKETVSTFVMYDPGANLAVHAYNVADTELGRVIVHNNTNGIVQG